MLNTISVLCISPWFAASLWERLLAALLLLNSNFFFLHLCLCLCTLLYLSSSTSAFVTYSFLISVLPISVFSHSSYQGSEVKRSCVLHGRHFWSKCYTGCFLYLMLFSSLGKLYVNRKKHIKWKKENKNRLFDQKWWCTVKRKAERV